MRLACTGKVKDGRRCTNPCPGVLPGKGKERQRYPADRTTASPSQTACRKTRSRIEFSILYIIVRSCRDSELPPLRHLMVRTLVENRAGIQGYLRPSVEGCRSGRGCRVNLVGDVGLGVNSADRQGAMKSGAFKSRISWTTPQMT